MTHFGLICPSSTGHLHTMLPLGQELKRRGHRITLIGILDSEAKTSAAELEEVFEYSLKFTETERILIWELLSKINPKDLLLICCKCSSPPGIRYSYEFNQTLNIVNLVQKLGLCQVILMILKGIWNKDYTHRRPAS